MVKVRIVYQSDDTFPETHYWCPVCHERARFYSVPHKKCPNCWYDMLPNIRKLVEEQDYRAEYHRESKI